MEDEVITVDSYKKEAGKYFQLINSHDLHNLKLFAVKMLMMTDKNTVIDSDEIKHLALKHELLIRTPSGIVYYNWHPMFDAIDDAEVE